MNFDPSDLESMHNIQEGTVSREFLADHYRIKISFGIHSFQITRLTFTPLKYRVWVFRRRTVILVLDANFTKIIL